MARLPELPGQLEAQVTARGGVGALGPRRRARPTASSSTWSGRTGADEVVKVKSMATQEIGLNEALEGAGIAAFETDLAELIVQLGARPARHILVPAIHRNRAEIREIFLREMPGVDPDADRRAPPCSPRPRGRTCAGSSSRAKVAISGANFARRRDRHARRWSSPRATAGCA